MVFLSWAVYEMVMLLAAMGSPVSAIVGNLYMEFFKEWALKSIPVRPRLWKRYVNNAYCMFLVITFGLGNPPAALER